MMGTSWIRRRDLGAIPGLDSAMAALVQDHIRMLADCMGSFSLTIVTVLLCLGLWHFCS